MRAAVVVIALAACGDNTAGPADATPTYPGVTRVGYGQVISAAIEAPDETATFVFHADAGDWVKPFPSSDGDLTITLRDGAGDDLATSRSPFPTHLAESGDYFVELRVVTDEEPPPPSVAYTFRVQHLRAGETYALDVEPNDDAAAAQSIAEAYDDEEAFVLGRFDAAEDLDVYRLRAPHDGPGLAYAAFTRGDEHGSTRRPGTAWITDAGGTEILGRAAIDGGEFLSAVVTGPGDFLLWITGAGAGEGRNDFYDLSVGRLVNRVFEREAPGLTGANDTIALADASDEVLPFTTSTVFVTPTLPPGDVDYLAIDVTGSGVTLSCRVGDGSGIVEGSLIAQLRDATDTSRGDAMTSAGAGVPFTVDPGRYYLYLTATAHDPEVAGHHVQCAYSLL